MKEIKIFDLPAKQIRLEYSIPESISDQLVMAQTGLDAAFLFFENLIHPFTVDLCLTFYDPDIEYPVQEPSPNIPFRMLRKKYLPKYVLIKPTWENEKVYLIDDISRETIEKWINQIFNQYDTNESDTYYYLGWKQIIFKTNQCRLPYSDFNPEKDIILLNNVLDTIHYPTVYQEDSVWIQGPINQKSPNAPIEVILDNLAGLLTLDIFLYWSVFMNTNEPGTNLIETSLNKLVDIGWNIKKL